MKNTKKIIYLLTIASLVQIIFGHHAILPTYLKVILGGCDMIALFYAIEDLDKWGGKTYIKNMLFMMIAYISVLLIRAMLSPQLSYTTYLFSPFYTFAAAVPLFTIMVGPNFRLRPFVVCCALAMLANVLWFRNVGLSYFIIALFFPYLKNVKWYLVIIIFALAVDLMYALDLLGYNENPRSYIVEGVCCVALIFFVWFRNSEKMSKYAQYVLFTLGVAVVYGFLSGKYSFFEIMSQESSNEKMALDTRSFLYYEVFDNMRTLDDWLFGKGIGGGYVSDYFGTTVSNARGTVEVNVLNTFLHGGLVLLLIHLTIMITAVFNCFKKANNRFCRACGFIVSIFFFNVFIVDYPSRISLVQIIPWICCGFCLSDYWLSKSDSEINKIIVNQIKL